MTSALAVIALTFDGVDLQTLDDGIFIEITAGIAESPVVRGEDTVIPSAAGTLEGNRVVDHLPLELRAKILADEAETTLADQRASHYDNIRTVRALFSPSRDRAPLVATLPSGTVLTIQARPMNIVSAEIVGGEYSELSIALEGDSDWVAS